VPEPPLDDRANDASPCLGLPTYPTGPTRYRVVRLDLLTRRVVGTPSRGDALEGRSGAASSQADHSVPGERDAARYQQRVDPAPHLRERAVDDELQS
jgi:hypothetical protein